MELEFQYIQIFHQNCRRRIRFVEIKKRLQHLKVMHVMLYPTWLRITALGELRFFSTSNESLAWLEKNEGKLQTNWLWNLRTCFKPSSGFDIKLLPLIIERSRGGKLQFIYFYFHLFENDNFFKIFFLLNFSPLFYKYFIFFLIFLNIIGK